MKAINTKYVLVKKVEEPQKEGFQTVDVQDNFIYKGKIEHVPQQPVYVDNHPLEVGDVVLFAKYSPDTHDMDVEGQKMKALKAEDIIVVL